MDQPSAQLVNTLLEDDKHHGENVIDHASHTLSKDLPRPLVAYEGSCLRAAVTGCGD